MKQIIFLIALLFSVSAVWSQETYEKAIFVSPTQGDSLRYRFLVPEGMNPEEKYPLVLFLHGAGERGSDNEKQLLHGGQMFLNPVNREKHPAYVLFPQCPESAYGAYNGEEIDKMIPEEMPMHPHLTPTMRILKELLDSYLALPQVDRERVYVIGLSMGAMATYDIVIRHPELFAAAVPICGTVNPNRLKRAKGITEVSFRIFHGDADAVVLPAGSRKAYKALKSIGADVEYIEFPGCTHGSWNPAFNRPDFMEWLFGKKKQ